MAERILPMEFYEELGNGATHKQLRKIADGSRWMVRDELDRIKDCGFRVVEEEVNPQTHQKQFILQADPERVKKTLDSEVNPNHSERREMSSARKQMITREAREYLEKLERETLNVLNELGRTGPERDYRASKGGEDVVVHVSDDHFGDVVKDVDGNVVFNSDIAAERVNRRFDDVFEIVDMREKAGVNVENVHVLLGGDHVTNEVIYKQQPHDIDATIDEQLNRATAVYMDNLERLAERFDFVQVVCQSGNHGEMRVDGASTKANADRFLFDRLQMMVETSDVDNVRFVKSDRKDHVNFTMRGHTGHLRHGHHVRNHIGTSSPLSDWRSFLLQYEFDIAYRGHFHNHKIEHVNGVPVVMSPSIKPPGEFEGSMAVFDRAMSYIHGVSDENPLAWTEYRIYDMD